MPLHPGDSSVPSNDPYLVGDLWRGQHQLGSLLGRLLVLQQRVGDVVLLPLLHLVLVLPTLTLCGEVEVGGSVVTDSFDKSLSSDQFT